MIPEILHFIARLDMSPENIGNNKNHSDTGEKTHRKTTLFGTCHWNVRLERLEASPSFLLADFIKSHLRTTVTPGDYSIPNPDPDVYQEFFQEPVIALHSYLFEKNWCQLWREIMFFHKAQNLSFLTCAGYKVEGAFISRNVLHSRSE